ncbi:MAG TPA: transcriptional regulator, partial [Treponema sp.]|nr:transcriptional regulator [Treponema sp.]
MSYSLIITIVSHGKADLVTLAATQAGSTGGTVLRGRGISPNAIAAALGIESAKDV